jgi:hypothetical protein
VAGVRNCGGRCIGWRNSRGFFSGGSLAIHLFCLFCLPGGFCMWMVFYLYFFLWSHFL